MLEIEPNGQRGPITTRSDRHSIDLERFQYPSISISP